jgi:prevent-host-death family protein
MPIIKPISDLRNKTNQISELVHKSHEPVFITKNGEGDMMLMSLATYGEIERMLIITENWRSQSRSRRGELRTSTQPSDGRFEEADSLAPITMPVVCSRLPSRIFFC